MKSNKATSILSIFACVALCYCHVAGAQDEQDPDTAKAILTKGWWTLRGNPDHATVFRPDGTVLYGSVDEVGTVSERPAFRGEWVVTGTCVVRTYTGHPDKRDTYFLPIEPGATHGADEKGNPLLITRKSGTPAIYNARTGALEIASNVNPAEPAASPAAASDIEQNGPVGGMQTSQLITSILTTGIWNTEKGRLDHATVFYPDGTFLFGVLYSDGTFFGKKVYGGTWEIERGSVKLTYNRQGFVEVYFQPINPAGTRGVDQDHKPLLMTRRPVVPKLVQERPGAAGQPLSALTSSTPAPANTIPIELQRSAAALVQTYHNSLAFVTGATGSGSGFVAAIGKANYLVTSVHVASQTGGQPFKGLDGPAVPSGVPSMAVGEDIFCMALPAQQKPFEVMQDVDANAAIGDPVAVLGNADGVVNPIMGSITGIGPTFIEVDAPFLQDNSGGPIIHLKTGKVIGVAAYQVKNKYDMDDAANQQEAVVRRIGYRLDSVKGWQAVTWPAFNVQAAQMQGIEKLTDDLYDLYRDMTDNKGAVTPGRHDDTAFKIRLNDWLAEKASHPSPEDAATDGANLFSFLKSTSQADITAAQGQMTFDYFLRELPGQKQTRDAILKGLQQLIQGAQ